MATMIALGRKEERKCFESATMKEKENEKCDAEGAKNDSLSNIAAGISPSFGHSLLTTKRCWQTVCV